MWKHQPVPSACEGSQSRGEAGAPGTKVGCWPRPAHVAFRVWKLVVSGQGVRSVRKHATFPFSLCTAYIFFKTKSTRYFSK